MKYHYYVKKIIKKGRNRKIIKIIRIVIIIRAIIYLIVHLQEKEGSMFIKNKVILIKINLESCLSILIVIPRKNKIRSYSKIYRILKIIKKNLKYNKIINKIRQNLKITVTI